METLRDNTEPETLVLNSCAESHEWRAMFKRFVDMQSTSTQVEQYGLSRIIEYSAVAADMYIVQMRLRGARL